MKKISATTPDISGDFRRSPVAGSRRKPAPGRLPTGSADHTSSSVMASSVQPANRRPRRSDADRGAPIDASAASASNARSGKRCAVNFSVTHQPSSVMTGVENAMKYQLAAGLTE